MGSYGMTLNCTNRGGYVYRLGFVALAVHCTLCEHMVGIMLLICMTAAMGSTWIRDQNAVRSFKQSVGCASALGRSAEFLELSKGTRMHCNCNYELWSLSTSNIDKEYITA